MKGKYIYWNGRKKECEEDRYARKRKKKRRKFKERKEKRNVKIDNNKMEREDE